METPENLDAIVAAVVPSLPPFDRVAAPEAMDRGFGSLVLRFGGTIVRVARNDETRRGHELEARLLPALAGRLSAAVPHPMTVIPAGEGVPFGAVAYPAIPGRPITSADVDAWPSLPIDLAHLLAGVHGTPLVRATAAGVASWLPEEQLPVLAAASSDELAARLTEPELQEFTARWDELTPLLTARGPVAVLCHGDPWYDNVLVDPASGRLTGMIDFEGAVVADPALDLAAVFHMGKRFGSVALDAYTERRGRDATLPARVRAHRLIREVSGLAYALRNDQPEEIPDVVTTIRELLSTPG